MQHRHTTVQPAQLKQHIQQIPPQLSRLAQTSHAVFWSSPTEWKMNIIFVRPWTPDSEYQSSIPPDRTNKSWNLFQMRGDESVHRKKWHHFWGPARLVWTCTYTGTYSSIVSTYSHHTLEKKMTFNLSTLLEMERLLFRADSGQAAFQLLH